MYISRLRLSSHPLPIEVLRFRGNKKEVKREDRKCTICNLDAMGDENHYLLQCTNGEISKLREDFMKNIKEEVPQFKQFTNENIIEYCMNLKDTNIQLPISVYVKNILNTNCRYNKNIKHSC